MAKTLVVLAVLACLVAVALAGGHEDRKMFHKWMKEQGKKYATSAEYELRFKNFQKNMKKIEKAQKASPSAVFAPNKFADLHEDEWKQIVPKKYPAQALAWSCLAGGVTAPQLSAVDLPTSFDWRTKGVVSRVKDQGQCGSCWTFSTIGNIESQNAIKTGTITEFSEQELVDCSQGCSDEYQYGPVCNQGCDGGWQWNAFFDIISWKGVMTEADYPYTAEDGTCQRDPSKTLSPIKNYTCLSTYNVSGGADENQMAAFLVQNGPLSVALNADLLMSYTSGIINPDSSEDCDGTELDHALLIVGYDVDSTTNTPYWIIKNSWNEDWGEQGYFRIVRGKGACGLNNAVSTATM